MMDNVVPRNRVQEKVALPSEKRPGRTGLIRRNGRERILNFTYRQWLRHLVGNSTLFAGNEGWPDEYMVRKRTRAVR